MKAAVDTFYTLLHLVTLLQLLERNIAAVIQLIYFCAVRTTKSCGIHRHRSDVSAEISETDRFSAKPARLKLETCVFLKRPFFLIARASFSCLLGCQRHPPSVELGGCAWMSDCTCIHKCVCVYMPVC